MRRPGQRLAAMHTRRFRLLLGDARTGRLRRPLLLRVGSRRHRRMLCERHCERHALPRTAEVELYVWRLCASLHLTWPACDHRATHAPLTTRPPLLSPSLSPKLTRAHLRDSHSLRILAPRRPTRRGTTAAIPGAAATSIAATTLAHPPASSSGWDRGSRHATASRTPTSLTTISPPVLGSGQHGAGRMRSGTTS